MRSICRQVRPLIAAALYERPAAEEAELIDSHLQSCPGCREEHARLQQLVTTVSAEPVVFEGDLLPALREQLRSGAFQERRWSWSRRLASAAVLAGVVLVAGAYFRPYLADVPLGGSITQVAQASAVEEAIQTANGHMAAREYAPAAAILREAVTEHPDDPAAGEALVQLAHIEFEELQRYPKAYEAYDRLRQKYWDEFKSNAVCGDRLDLLAEAQRNDFEELYALDAVRGAGPEAFERLETMMARRPGSLVAARAVDKMVTLLRDGNGNVPRSELLLQARRHVAQPEARAQVNLALAECYLHEEQNMPQAHAVYQEVAQKGPAPLAGKARRALAALEVPTAR